MTPKPAAASSPDSSWCTQAKLPRTLHPPYQASLHQELTAVASLHAAIRSGGTVPAVEGTTLEECLEDSAKLWDSCMSPTGTAAAILWCHAHGRQASGITLAARPAGTSAWVPHAVSITGLRFAASATGCLFGCLHRPGEGSCWSIQFFDALAGHWLPQLQLHDSASWDFCGDISFSEDGALAFAPVPGSGGVVCHVQEATVQRLVLHPDNGSMRACWLPGSHELLLMQPQTHALALAAFGSSTGKPASEVHPVWVRDAAWAARSHHSWSGTTSVLPSGLILVVNVLEVGLLYFCFYGHDLHRRSSQSMPVPRGAGLHLDAAVASRSALALTFSRTGTWVYSLQESGVVGSLMFAVPFACGLPSFCLDGHFLAGIVLQAGKASHEVHVLDCNTGICVACICTPALWPGKPEGPDELRTLQPTRAAWTCERRSRLLVSSCIHSGDPESVPCIAGEDLFHSILTF